MERKIDGKESSSYIYTIHGQLKDILRIQRMDTIHTVLPQRCSTLLPSLGNLPPTRSALEAVRLFLSVNYQLAKGQALSLRTVLTE